MFDRVRMTKSGSGPVKRSATPGVAGSPSCSANRGLCPGALSRRRILSSSTALCLQFPKARLNIACQRGQLPIVLPTLLIIQLPNVKPLSLSLDSATVSLHEVVLKRPSLRPPHAVRPTRTSSTLAHSAVGMRLLNVTQTRLTLI